MKEQLIAEFDKYINPERIEATAHFFGICPGGYGEGDILLGLSVPRSRKIALEYKNMPEDEIVELLHSKVHEHRFAALEILVAQYKKNPERSRRILLENIEAANNWDLIDVITWKILGMWALEHHDERIFHEFAKSEQSLEASHRSRKLYGILPPRRNGRRTRNNRAASWRQRTTHP